MDDIQFWIYIIFAVIYFVVKGLRKKDPDKTPKPKPNRPASDRSAPQRPERKPVSFEELLKEFTEGKSPDPEPEEEFEQPYARQEEPDYQSVKELQKEEEEQEFEEGKTRRFSDDESKRIYEQSIARAEGSKIEFKKDEHFRSKLKRRDEQEESTSNQAASEIRDMLNNPDDARKAVILGEILNRKY